MVFRLQHFYSFIFCIGISYLARAQDHQTILKSSQPDSTKIDSLIWLSEKYASEKEEEAFILASVADSIAAEAKLVKHKIRAVIAMAIASENKGAYTKAINLNEQALLLAGNAKDSARIAKAYLNLGNIYFTLNDSSSSHRNIEKAIYIYERLEDKRGRSFSYMALGNLYAEAKDYEKSKEYYQRSLAIKQQLGDEKGIGKTLSNIGLILKLQKKYDEALNYSFQSLEIKKKLKNANSISNTLSTVSEIYLLKGDKANGLEYAQQAWQYAKEGNNLYYQRTALAQLINATDSVKNTKAITELLRLYKINSDSLITWEKNQAAEKRLKEFQLSQTISKEYKTPDTYTSTIKPLLYGLMALCFLLILLVFYLLRKKRR
jgi:tetratricopeptide (TPR) repeat protein